MDAVAAGAAAVAEAGRSGMAAAVGMAQGHDQVDVEVPVGTTVASFGTQLVNLGMALPVTGDTEYAAMSRAVEQLVVMEDRLRADGQPE